MKNRKQPFTDTDVIVWTNGTGAAVKAGDDLGKEGVVRIGAEYGIAMVDIAAAKSGAVLTKGEVAVCKAAGVTFAVGDRLGWSSAAKEVTTDTSGGVLIVVTRAAASADTLVYGELNAPGGDAPGFAAAQVAASAAVTNTTTPTKFDQQHVIPANSLRVGDVVRIRAQVIHTATNSTDTSALKAFIGATEVAAVAAVDVANGDVGIIDIDVPIRTIGAGGTCVAAGWGSIGVPGTATAKAIFKASQAIDTTVANAVAIEETWSVANAGNSSRLDILDVQVIRRGSALA